MTALPGPERVARRLAASEGWTGVVGDGAACPECSTDPWRLVASDLVVTGRGYMTVSPDGVSRVDPRRQQ